MAVVTIPAALTTAAFAAGPIGPTVTEQNLDITNGNKFPLGPNIFLIARNTTGGALGIDFYADQAGNEVKVIDGTVAANKVPANGEKIFGPFDSKQFGDHALSITITPAPSQVVCKQNSGTAGQIVVSPVALDRGA